MFAIVMEPWQCLPYLWFEQKYSAASYCKLQTAFVIHMMRWQTIPELCVELGGMERSWMTFPGSWIFDTYLYKTKYKASIKLQKSVGYTMHNKESTFWFPWLQILLGHSNTGALRVVTIIEKCFVILCSYRRAEPQRRKGEARVVLPSMK